MSHWLSCDVSARLCCPRRSSPRLEGLEDRRLLATFNPLPSAADGSPGSLRAAIIQADSNGQDNTIDLQAGAYLLTLANTAGEDNGAAQGDLDLTGADTRSPSRGPAPIQGTGWESEVRSQ